MSTKFKVLLTIAIYVGAGFYAIYSIMIMRREADRQRRIENHQRKFRETVESEEYQNLPRMERFEYLFKSMKELKKI